jgi:TRAP-type C4-dicarboxylate transport system permease small subunit
MQIAGILLLVVTGITTHLSRRATKPASGLALWIVYVLSLAAGVTLLVAP